jgi:GTP diphosphokinase / guanosine-3',5'-bis(diphosphate) 3'-diphosphatase
MSLQMLMKAANFAAVKHKDQRRKDKEASPYINHCLAVAEVLATEGGVDDAEVLCAALLHDTVEDTGTLEAELQAEFGARITSIVLEVTDDKNLAKELRKEAQVEHARHASAEAKLVKLADKICNLRDLLRSPPVNWDVERKRAYFTWSARVVDGVRGSNPRLEKTFDELMARRGELKV